MINSPLGSLYKREIHLQGQSFACSLLGEYCHGDPRDAGALPLFVAQLNLPNMGGAPDVDRARDSGNPTLGDAAQMVGVDLEANRPMAWRRRACRATRAEHLGEQDG